MAAKHVVCEERVHDYEKECSWLERVSTFVILNETDSFKLEENQLVQEMR